MTTAQITTAQPSAESSAEHARPLARLAHGLQDGTLDAKQLGAAGEAYAAGWLEHHGWRVLSRNWRTRYGELDIVALTPEDLIAFVEVKTRRSLRCGLPQDLAIYHPEFQKA